jgi:hypothetical protein
MAFSFRVVGELGLVVMRMRGEVSIDEIVEIGRTISDHPDWRPTFDSLTVIDPDAGLHEFDARSVDRMSAAVKAHRVQVGWTGVRSATICSTEMSAIIVRLYTTRWTPGVAPAVTYRVFDDAADALAWLDRPEARLDEIMP